MAEGNQDYSKLFNALGCSLSNIELLKESLTHVSYAEGKSGHKNYERLEFLGDRVIGLLVAEMLYKSFPDEKEGVIARRFSNLVCRDSLALISKEIGLDEFLILGNSEEMEKGREKEAILEDVCEAVIGAVYLEHGLDVIRGIINKYWLPHIEEKSNRTKDDKTLLQELVQSQKLPLPEYNIVNIEGAEHEPIFTVSVSVENNGEEKGIGTSKKKAEQEAAKNMLKRINSNGV